MKYRTVIETTQSRVRSFLLHGLDAVKPNLTIENIQQSDLGQKEGRPFGVVPFTCRYRLVVPLGMINPKHFCRLRNDITLYFLHMSNYREETTISFLA